MLRILVKLINDCDGNQLNYNNDLPEIGNKKITTETFRNRFFDSNRQRKTPTIIRHLLSSPRHPILHSDIFFYVKLFATIILS